MIELRDVRKAFGRQQVLDGLDLTVEAGSSYAVMGPSGSGKSVLLKHVIGLLKPDSGRVLVAGHSVPELHREELRDLRRDMGYLFQHGALINWLSVFDNIALPLRETTAMGEEEVRGRVEKVLGQVQLSGTDDKYPSEISGGMQKRVGLARALVTEPSVILYDEPEAGLDPGMSQAISELMRQIQTELEMTSLVVTHSDRCARIVADRLGIFEKGRFLVEGTPAEVLDSDHPRVREFLGPKRS
ncbi:MAG: ATP-binding cassette domain-containing protein [Planctomycetes bacterium]|nr:ATP-binding cassette domain-containing protein [Planctomycetota bacterium]MBL7007780.1 ATP-binding cassette domain-containing protein [Planctomycetota bacterium]